MIKQPLKIIFAGTPDFASTALLALIDKKYDIRAVYCQPDRPSGRGKKIVYGPVKQLALTNQIPVEQPNDFKDPQTIARLKAYQADLMIVVAYGLLLPLAVLDAPKYGCVNIHASLLPRWRGAAPIQRAIEAGDTESGVTIMQMDAGLDTGNMLLKRSSLIESSETGSSLHDKLATLGGQAIVQYLEEFNPNESGSKQNNALANYAHKLTKKEAEIDWSQASTVIEKQIRAFNAWPVSFSYIGNKRLRIWQAKITNHLSNQSAGSIIGLSKSGIEVVCGDQKTLLLTQLQADGSKAMHAGALLNARKNWFENSPILGRYG